MTATGPKLSVNVNAIAMLRNRRDLPWPDPARLSRIALEAGAHGITVHPRPDQRHVRFSDLPVLSRLVAEHGEGAEFNIEGYPSPDFLDLVLANRPHQVTLVPDDPTQSTSDHGFDFAARRAFLTETVARLKDAGLRVSLFADPTPDGLEIAAQTGADRVEFYTGPYGATHSDDGAAARALDALGRAGDRAVDLGLGVNVGHDLTLSNLPPLVERMPYAAEASIGHALTADALELGLAGAVRAYVEAMRVR
ncbi:pyridoxine 5'-phosphate synthase [Aureimonas sp. Leaf454]|uniref:pyridoxine 5'-phosphate synthase n=1 Tax=Aureimonas sp. Leaf454 TaxID=1736381 RepID=UPI000700E795|nr:pyridoxine 5'-phosphate synthase [Aureimonas sp. Leaf454]KQT53096.1 pyridoxine 5'-phosphate synthase [Aureimonas sp. Leaf454]